MSLSTFAELVELRAKAASVSRFSRDCFSAGIYSVQLTACMLCSFLSQ